MIRIYKQELDIGRPIFLMDNPKIVKPLSLQQQGHKLVFWYEADIEKTENYVCYEYWTGDEIDTKGTYIGTIQEDDLVYHFYYIKESEFNIKNY